MDLEGQRRTRTRDNPMAIVIVFDLGNDRDAFVVGDETAGEFGNKLNEIKIQQGINSMHLMISIEYYRLKKICSGVGDLN